MDIERNWADLRHAYGPATDIPPLLRQLRTAPPPATHKDEPWFSLWSALCHQGDVYTASYAALPELVRVAGDREPAAAVECLYLAALIELVRHNITAPVVPEELKTSYKRAIADAHGLCGRITAAGLGKDRLAMLEINKAVFAGQLAAARRLVDAA